jgi:transposase-like protein
VAAIIAVAVNTDGKREIVGLHIGPSEAETFWSGFLKSLARRGLRGVKLVISDAHEGLKAAIRRAFGATWQRCRVHWMRNALSYVAKTQQSMVAAALRQAFIQPDRVQAASCRRSAAAEMAEAVRLHRRQRDGCAVTHGFSRTASCQGTQHQPTGTVKQGGQTARRCGGHLPERGSIIRLIGAVLLEQNDEWQLQHRYMQVEAMAELMAPANGAEARQIAAAA